MIMCVLWQINNNKIIIISNRQKLDLYSGASRHESRKRISRFSESYFYFQVVFTPVAQSALLKLFFFQKFDYVLPCLFESIISD